MIRTVLAFLYTTYTREFYAKRFSIKASLGYQQGNVGIKFCHYTARNVWHNFFPLYSKAKTAVLCHVLRDPAWQCHAVGDVVLQTWSCRLSGGWATIMKLQTAHHNNCPKIVIYPPTKVVFELTTFTLQHDALTTRLRWTWYSWSWLFIHSR